VHDLRHLFAAIMLETGANIYEASEQMGHAGYRITLDVYAHLIPREYDSHPLDATPAAPPARPCAQSHSGHSHAAGTASSP
jgi:hypothetical protein